jgi:hypothetical protein
MKRLLHHLDNCLLICNYGLLIYYTYVERCRFYNLRLMYVMFCELAVRMHS